MTPVVVLLCVIAAASAFPQTATNPYTPTLNSRSEQYDEARQYQISYDLSDGQAVHETGYLKTNNANDGLVLIKRGYYQYPTPEGKVVQVEYLADETGYNIISSNSVPVAPTPVAPTF